MPADLLLARDLVRSLDADERAALLRVATDACLAHDDTVTAPLRERLLTRLPNVLRHDAGDGALRFNAPELAGLFAAALTEGVAPAAADPLPGRILDALTAGDTACALDLLHRAGGSFFVHCHGDETCLRVLDAFPRAMQQNEPLLVLARAMHALDAGCISRARHLIGQRYGAEALDLQTALANPQRFPVELRLFRFLMTPYEDLAIGDPMRARLYEMLGELPLDAHLQRGSFCHAMLEIHLRVREFDAAAQLARRAGHHYAAAQAHRPGFHIAVHQAIFALMRGAPGTAGDHARDARETLERAPFHTDADVLALAFVEAVIGYEKGETGPLVRFLRCQGDGLANGETWPALADLAVDYGGGALARHVTLNTARAFLNTWHMQEWRSNRFRLAVTLREVALLQDANRWQEAAGMLTAVQSRINRIWVEGAVDSLARLADPSEIAIAMAWLRHLVREVPGRILLRDQLGELLRNTHVGARQRITLRLWSAHLARARRDISAARAALLEALEASARLGTVLPLVEESAMLRKLAQDRRIGSFVIAAPEARDVLDRMKAFDTPVAEGARDAGLTRQEMRVLTLAAEGGTNKSVARGLGLSEVTVKFHLSNVYRKMGGLRRSEVIAAARARGWIG